MEASLELRRAAPRVRREPFAARQPDASTGRKRGPQAFDVSVTHLRHAGRGQCVAIYAPALRHARCLEQTLQCAYRISTHDDWRAFLEALDSAGAAIVLCPRLGHDVMLASLAELSARRSQMPWLLITDGASDNLRLLVHVRATDVLCWGIDDRRVSLALRGILESTQLKSLADRYRQMCGLSPLLHAAIAHLFAQTWEERESDCRPPLRSIHDLAERLQCSEDTLSTAARRHGINLRHMINWVLTLWAIQLHQRGGTWEAAAWQLDYCSMSGLSDLFVRTVGVRPTALPVRSMTEWCAEFERATATSE